VTILLHILHTECCYIASPVDNSDFFHFRFHSLICCWTDHWWTVFLTLVMESPSTVVRFLTRTFSNVFYVRVTIGYLAYINPNQSLLIHKTTHNTKCVQQQATLAHTRGVSREITWPTARAVNLLSKQLKCMDYRWRTRQSSKLAQECKFFQRILLLFYGNSSPRTIRFLGKWTVTSERSR